MRLLTRLAADKKVTELRLVWCLLPDIRGFYMLLMLGFRVIIIEVTQAICSQDASTFVDDQEVVFASFLAISSDGIAGFDYGHS